MCEAKKPLYWLVNQDSRAASELGRGLGWDGLRDEGKRNQANPGHAIGKAAQYAATWYLGSLLGGAGDAASAGGDAAATAGEVAGGAGEQAAQQLAQQAALEQAAEQEAAQGIQNTTMESGLEDTGYTPSSLYQAIKNTGHTTPLQQNLLNYGKQQMANATNGSLLNTMESNASGKLGANLATKYGSSLLSPQQTPQQAPQRPAGGGQVTPLPMPYGPTGNALNLSNMSEAELKRLRAMGYPV